MRTNLSGAAGAGLAALALSLSVVACTDMFTNGDCSSTRTCEPTAGRSAEGGDGGAGDVAPGGAGGVTAGGASTRGDECEVANDCANGDAEDGEEGCDNGYCVAGNPAPTVISVSPADQTTDVEPGTEIVIEFSEELDPASVTAANIQVLDGDEAIAGELSYEGTKVVFKPQFPLGLLARYDVAVATGVTDAEGAPLLEEFASSLVVRDGAWAITPVVAEPIALLSDSLPITDSGDALLSWVAKASADQSCPTKAQWFRAGQSLGSSTNLTTETAANCSLPHASVGASGDGLVLWHELAGARAARFQAGTWSAATPVSRTKVPGSAISAVGTDGVSHHIEANPAESAVEAFVTDAKGKWSSAPFTLSEESATQPALAVTKGGLAAAAYCAVDSVTSRQKIVFASYTPDKHAWSKGTALSGSQAEGTGSSFARSRPAVALSEQGDAMVLWIAEQRVMASRLPAGSSQWSEPIRLSGSLLVLSNGQAPALVFDGETFVAAWTTVAGTILDVNVARYDAGTESWGAYQTLGDKNTASTQRMPQLVSDAHQNLFLVWPTALKGNAGSTLKIKINAQRFLSSTGTWGPPQVVANESDPGLLDEGSPLPFSMNRGGVAAFATGTPDTVNGGYTDLRIAAFH